MSAPKKEKGVRKEKTRAQNGNWKKKKKLRGRHHCQRRCWTPVLRRVLQKIFLNHDVMLRSIRYINLCNAASYDNFDIKILVDGFILLLFTNLIPIRHGDCLEIRRLFGAGMDCAEGLPNY